MKRHFAIAAAALAATAFSGVQAKAAILFQSIGSPSTNKSFNGSASTGTTGAGVGDDYTTIFPGSSVSLTGLTFYGGTSTLAASLAINFYDMSGNLDATILPTAAEVLGNTSYHTLLSTDFGSGVTVPGSGYFILTPYATAGDGSVQVGFFGYGSSAPAVGTDFGGTNGAEQTNSAGVLSTLNVVGFGATNVGKFELDGTSVPEPTTIALLTPVAMLLGRRRRSR